MTTIGDLRLHLRQLTQQPHCAKQIRSDQLCSSKDVRPTYTLQSQGQVWLPTGSVEFSLTMSFPDLDTGSQLLFRNPSAGQGRAGPSVYGKYSFRHLSTESFTVVQLIVRAEHAYGHHTLSQLHPNRARWHGDQIENSVEVPLLILNRALIQYKDVVLPV